jgi:transcriptional regulator with XRE-family HTH domain
LWSFAEVSTQSCEARRAKQDKLPQPAAAPPSDSSRKSQKLRQDQLAGAANVGLRFIVDLEAGKPTAQIGKVLTVQAALGVTMEMKAPEARPVSLFIGNVKNRNLQSDVAKSILRL